MGKWFKARWKAYADSIDPVVATAGSTPTVMTIAVVFLTGVYLALHYVPALAEKGGFPLWWLSTAMTLFGGALTVVAWRQTFRGSLGLSATLFDNALYSTSLALCAVGTRGTTAIAIAVAHGFVTIFFSGQLYSFSLLFSVVSVLPIAVLIATFQPPLPVAFILACGTIGMLVFTEITRGRRNLVSRQHQLEEALGAADRVADESVQAALANTLLTLGHFLHELRNYQTAVSTNLQFIELQSELDEPSAKALEEAQEAQREQEALLKNTIADLKSRAKPVSSSFLLRDALNAVATESRELSVEVTATDFDFELTGHPEHLRVILLNLIRNAEQAGATAMNFVVRLEPSGHSVALLIHNNGEPIPSESRQHLFDSFVVSTKPGGSGLGLYLVRRYAELLGGRITAQDPSTQGAAFLLQLPGKLMTVQPASSSTTSVQKSVSS